jgi:hypothetical protein
MYGSTCFGCLHANHQELNNCSSSPWYRWNVEVAVLLVAVGLAGRPVRPRPTALLPPRSNGKTRGCYCSCWAPDDWREDARNILSRTLTSSNKLASSWLIYWICMMIHGLKNFKFTFNIICSVYCECTHLYIPTHKQKLYKITNNICTSTYLLPSTINRHTQRDINRKEWKFIPLGNTVECVSLTLYIYIYMYIYTYIYIYIYLHCICKFYVIILYLY